MKTCSAGKPELPKVSSAKSGVWPASLSNKKSTFTFHSASLTVVLSNVYSSYVLLDRLID